MPPSLPLLVGLMLATLAPGMAQQPAEGNVLLDHALASVRSLSSAGLVTPEEEQAAVRRMVQMDDRLLVSLLASSKTRALMAHASQPFSHPRSIARAAACEALCGRCKLCGSPASSAGARRAFTDQPGEPGECFAFGGLAALASP